MKTIRIICNAILHPILGLTLNLVSLALAVVGLTQYKNDAFFSLLFIIPFLMCILLTISLTIISRYLSKLQTNEKKALNVAFRDNLHDVLSEHKNCQSLISYAYEQFGSALSDEYLESLSEVFSEGDAEEIIIDEINKKEIFRDFYKDIKRANNTFFKAVVESLRNVVEYNVNTLNNNDLKVAVCIKQLSRCHHKQGRQIPDDLNVYAVYRNEVAYKAGREIGHSYQVNANTTFRACLLYDNFREAVFIENDIPKAIEDGKYDCENKNDLLANKTYNATMVVPITHKDATEKYYYGYLCIDTVANVKNAFVKDELLSIMQCYSDLLAAHYHLISMYFPFIFDYVYDQHKKQETTV